MLAVHQILLHNGNELGIVNKAADQGIEQRGKVADGGGKEQAAGTQHAAGLSQCLQASRARRQMIERAEKQDRIEGMVRLGQSLGVADRNGSNAAGVLANLLDLGGNEVEKMNFVAALGHPIAVNSGSAANVENAAGRRRQVAQDEFLGARQFQHAPARLQPAFFGGVFVMGEHFAHSSSVNGEKPVVSSRESGVRSQESGVSSQESGVRSGPACT